jgi:importin subunit beta-1
MHALLQILNTLNNKSSVADSVFAAVGGLANALGEDFENYMSAFSPYLYRALGNKEEPGLCAMAIGLVSDITRALEEKALPYCNDFMNYLLENLRVSRSCSIS